MCGIAGGSTPRLSSPDMFKLLLLDNEARGKHSTGLATLKKLNSSGKPTKNTMTRLRSTSRAGLFISDPKVNRGLVGNEIITHTRHATMGAHSEDNAHPFKFGNVMGTHNGWLIDFKKCTPAINKYTTRDFCNENDYKLDDFDVDSMLIFHHLNQTQDLNSITDIHGAMALAFIWDGKLNIYRRESKPLYIVENKRGMFYSSREEGLEMVFGKDADIKEVPTDMVLQFDRGKQVGEVKIKTPELKISEDETPSAFYGRTRAAHRPSNNWNNNRYSTTGNNSTSNQSRSNDDGGSDSGAVSSTVSKYRDRTRNMQGSINAMAPNVQFDSSRYRKVNTIVSKYSALNVFDHYLPSMEGLKCLGYTFDKAEYSDFVFKQDVTPFPENSCKFLVKVVDSSDKSNQTPLKGWRVVLDSFPETLFVTDENGLCAMSIPEKVFNPNEEEKVFTVTLNPPAGYSLKIGKQKYYPRKQYYIEGMTLHKGRVMEVTLAIPFGKDEAEAQSSGVYFPIDGQLSAGQVTEDSAGSDNSKRAIVPTISRSIPASGSSEKNRIDLGEASEDPFLSEDEAYRLTKDLEEILTGKEGEPTIDTYERLTPPDPQELSDSEANMLSEVHEDLKALATACNVAASYISEAKEMTVCFEMISTFIKAWTSYPARYYADEIAIVKGDWISKIQSPSKIKGSEDGFEGMQKRCISEIGDKAHELFNDLTDLLNNYVDEVHTQASKLGDND